MYSWLVEHSFIVYMYFFQYILYILPNFTIHHVSFSTCPSLNMYVPKSNQRFWAQIWLVCLKIYTHSIWQNSWQSSYYYQYCRDICDLQFEEGRFLNFFASDADVCLFIWCFFSSRKCIWFQKTCSPFLSYEYVEIIFLKIY